MKETIKNKWKWGEVTSSGSGGSLDGLENGYDVMFYDEFNMGLAFYSIRQGNSINPPYYICTNWKTSDGEIVTFPYTPSGDVIFYATNSTYADKLYEFYRVDKEEYPYLVIALNKSNFNVQILFGKTVWFHEYNRLGFNNTLYNNGSITDVISDFSDVNMIVNATMSAISELKTASSYYTNCNSDHHHYTNFESNVTVVAGNHSLSQTVTL